MFSYLTFRLLVVEKSGGRWQPRLVQGEPVVIDDELVGDSAMSGGI